MTKKPKSRALFIVRLIRARPRLFLSALFGVIVALATPSAWQLATRMLIGWNVGVVLYLVLVYILMARTESQHIANRAASQDEGRITMLALTVAAAVATIVAIMFELTSAKKGDPQVFQLTLALITILSSWVFIHTIFALHYAHEYYGEWGGKKSGLNFPGDGEDPDYWDFVYFSFVIGMTAQVSDVAVTSKAIRQTVTAHGIVSFLFNVSLLALTINIAANVI